MFANTLEQTLDAISNGEETEVGWLDVPYNQKDGMLPEETLLRLAKAIQERAEKAQAGKLSPLRRLTLFSRATTTSLKAVRIFTDALRASSGLQEVSFLGLGIDSQGAVILAENFLRGNTTLKTLIIGDTHIDAKGCAAIANALENNVTLRELSFSGIPIGHEGAIEIARILRRKTALEEITLCNCSIGIKGAKAVALSMQGNNTLKELNLTHNDIEDEGATAIALALQENKTLKRLDLSQNHIGQAGAAALALRLKVLEDLVLCFNQIGSIGAAHLADALKQGSALRSLYLYGNDIGDEGASYLATALASSESKLEILSLPSNGISDVGAVAMADSIGVNSESRLNIMCLSRNVIQDAGATALMTTFRFRKFEALDLSSNKISRECVERFLGPDFYERKFTYPTMYSLPPQNWGRKKVNLEFNGSFRDEEGYLPKPR